MTVHHLTPVILGGALLSAPLALLIGWSLEAVGGILIGALVLLAGIGARRGRRRRRLRSFSSLPSDVHPRGTLPPPRRLDGMPGPSFGGWRGAHTLDYMGVYETLKTEGGACTVCGGRVSVATLGAVYPAGDEAAFVCRDPACLRAAAAQSLEDPP